MGGPHREDDRLARSDVKSAGGRCQDVPKLPEMGCLSLVPLGLLLTLRTRNWGSVLRRTDLVDARRAQSRCDAQR